MKKIIFLFILCVTGLFCFGQITNPKLVKPSNTPMGDLAKLENQKTQLKQLLDKFNVQLTDLIKSVEKIDSMQKSLESGMKELEAQDKLHNFEITQLMSSYNQAETQSSNLQKKLRDPVQRHQILIIKYNQPGK